MSAKKERVIPSEYIPEVGSHVETIDGRDYLITNDAMYTFYQRTKGEFSPFFLSMRDDKKLLGCKCSKCGLVRVPPFLTHCPDCNFAPTEMIEVEQVGVMNSTPPIRGKGIPWGFNGASVATLNIRSSAKDTLTNSVGLSWPVLLPTRI